jgi:hypothetical protein
LIKIYMSKSIGNDIMILVAYVDIGSGVNAIQKVKSVLCLSFDMIELGPLYYCLGVEFLQIDGCAFMPHAKYAKSLLERFHTRSQLLH